MADMNDPMNVDAKSDEEQPRWSKGMFQIVFVSMGQGDCCVITCPDGRHIMIDCGSAQNEDEGREYFNVIHSNEVLKLEGSHQNQLEALILTHPDKDHHNKVTYVLDSENVEIKKVYFSLPYKEESKKNKRPKTSSLGKYKQGNTNQTLYDKKSQLCNVVLNQEKAKLICGNDQGISFEKKWNGRQWVDLKEEEVKEEEKPPSVCVACKQDKQEINDWSVSIIAGGVKKLYNDKSDADGNNAGSLVTLIEIGEEKILICGDATLSTENYLINKFLAKLANLDLIQVPHHGSDVSCSTDKFVNCIQAKQAVISVKKDEHAFKLPRFETVERYKKYANDCDANNYAPKPISSWKTADLKGIQKIKKSWDDSDQKYEEEKNDQNVIVRYVLTKTDKYFKGIRIIHGFNQSGEAKYILYQEQAEKNIQLTANGHVWYYFGGNGYVD